MNKLHSVSDITGEVSQIISAIREAEEKYDWQEAQVLYAKALSEIPASTHVSLELLLGRIATSKYLGIYEGLDADLQNALDIALQLNDKCLLARTRISQASVLNIRLQYDAAKIASDQALVAARASEDRGLEADALVSAGKVAANQGDNDRARELFEHALHMARSRHDLSREAAALFQLGSMNAWKLGQLAKATTLLAKSLAIARKAGDRRREMLSLNLLGLSTTDLSLNRAYREQSLAVAIELNDIYMQSRLTNNLAFFHYKVGLYHRAKKYAEQSVALADKLNIPYASLTQVTTLIECELGLQQYELAESHLRRERELSLLVGDERESAYGLVLRGWLDLALGSYERARDALLEAAHIYHENNWQAYEAGALAWLAAAELADSRWQAALEHTRTSVAIDETTSDFPTYHRWWWRFKALAANLKRRGRPDANLPAEQLEPQFDEQTWEALDVAAGLMLEGVDNLGDEGLRRSYLNRVAINREILETWALENWRRGLSLEPLFERKTSSIGLQDQLSRLVEVGNRLTMERNPETLPELILDEFVELSGAERVAVVMRGNDGELEIRAALNIDPGDSGTDGEQLVREGLWRYVNEVNRSRNARLWELEGEDVPGVPDPLSKRSIVVLPMVAGGRLWGVIFGDIRQLFGQFTNDDLDLLSLLANQGASALENAEWASGLERKVADRTMELRAANYRLERQNDELSTIYEVQHGLTRLLDPGAILELVGQKVRAVFDAEITYVHQFDETRAIVKPWFMYDRGLVDDLSPYPLGPGLTSLLIQKRKPIFLSSSQEGFDMGARVVPNALGQASAPESYMGVPIIADDRVLATLSVQSYTPRAFDQNSMGLLTTLATNVSVALENARLFEETSQRARQTVTLSEVGQDILATLDLPTVMQRIAAHATELLQASDSAVFLPNEEGNELRGYVAQGPVAQYVMATIIRPGEGIIGDLWQRGRAEVVNDSNSDPRTLMIPGTEMHAEERIMAVPLQTGDRSAGMMAAWRTGGALFTEDDLRFLQGLARQAAIAIENARLYGEVEEALAEAEIALAEAEEANLTKSAFLAKMSHELRTPLNAVIGFTRIVKRKSQGKLPDKQIKNLDKVLVSAEHLLGLINSVLDISKIESGLTDLKLVEVDVASLVTVTMQTTRPLIRPNVELVAVIARDIPSLYSDEEKLKQILLNLLSNSAKFTHEGRIVVRADVEGEQMLLTVEDTGIGIDEPELERIFEAFRQAGTGISQRYGGTGLGLPISLNLAKLLGGALVAESALDQGSTFVLSLPLATKQSG